MNSGAASVAVNRRAMQEIASSVELHAGHAVYVLNYPFDEDFLKQQRLRVVYHGRTTDVVVAVREDVERKPDRVN